VLGEIAMWRYLKVDFGLGQRDTTGAGSAAGWRLLRRGQPARVSANVKIALQNGSIRAKSVAAASRILSGSTSA